MKKSVVSQETDINRHVIKMRAGEAKDQYIVALEGLFQCNAGTRNFKNKLFKLIKAINPKIRVAMRDFYDAEDKYAYLVNLAKTQAQMENRAYTPTVEILNCQKQYLRAQQTCFNTVISVSVKKDTLLLADDFPTEENLKDLPPYLVTVVENGYQRQIQYPLTSLLTVIEYKFLADSENDDDDYEEAEVEEENISN